jgi:hypothetical protein
LKATNCPQVQQSQPAGREGFVASGIAIDITERAGEMEENETLRKNE